MTPEHPDARRLATYRLERDLTFDALAAEMTAAGYAIEVRTLYQVLTGRTTTPLDRTLHKISRFVKTIRGSSAHPIGNRVPPPRKRKTPKRRSAAA